MNRQTTVSRRRVAGIVLGMLVCLAVVFPVSAAKPVKPYAVACNASPGNTVVTFPTGGTSDWLKIVWYAGKTHLDADYAFNINPGGNTSPFAASTPSGATVAQLWLSTDDESTYTRVVRRASCR